MALFKLETPMTMKELGLRMGCDPSFVTSIADALEKHGLARREPSQRTGGARTSCSPRKA
jgi:DNA-binding MarR family transcriptional regulator